MRVPVNYNSSTQQHQSNQNHLVPTTATSAAVSSNNNSRRRSRSQFSDNMSSAVYNNNNNNDKDAPGSASPPDSASGNATQLPPTLPSSLHDPVLKRTYARGRYLGKGGFAWCYEVKDMHDGTAYALKVIPKTQTVKRHHRSKVLREIAIHYPLRHEHVVRLYSAFEDDANIYMILELCPVQSLIHVMKKKKTFSEAETRYYLRQLLNGVRYLHEDARVLHRDLKLGNMLLSEDVKVKIADFGLAAEMKGNGLDSTGQVCGTPNYISPEVLRKEGHSSASEAWAIGCIMYAMLVGKPPFETHSLDTTYSLILAYNYSYPANIRLNSSARDLIRLFLNPLPANRPTPAQALTHEFFSSAIPISMPPDSCPNSTQIAFCTTGTQVKTVRTTAVMASTHRIHNEVPPSQIVVVHTATTATATYRSSTPFEVFEENRCGGLMVKSDPVSAKGTTSTNHHHQGSQIATHQMTSAVSPYSSSSSASASNSAPSSSAMGSTFSSVCPMDAFGNVTFGANRENALTQWLYEMFHCINDALFSPQRTGYLPAEIVTKSNNILYVTKWIDYSNRYGFGCQYNNGGVSIMQNDRTRLCLSTDRRFCRRWRSDQNSNGCVSGSDILDLWTPANVAQGSLDVIRHFVDYMDANLMTGGFSDVPTPLTLAVPFVVLWRRFSEYLLIVLSDGTFQINFISHHTKVVLSRMTPTAQNQKTEVALTFIDQSRLARTSALSQAVGTIIDGVLLQRVRQLLGDYVLTPNDCFVAEI